MLICLSCTKTVEIRVPYRPVNLELDLSFQDKALKAIQAYKVYTPQNIDQANEQTGFGGVLVFHGLSSDGTGAFYAFDAACPYEALANIRITIDNAAVDAICPKCGSRFELLNGLGNPVGGPSAEGKLSLIKYQIRSNGNKIYVYN